METMTETILAFIILLSAMFSVFVIGAYKRQSERVGEWVGEFIVYSVGLAFKTLLLACEIGLILLLFGWG